ncbi:uncharacterized protein LOC143244653 isoform X2 [Tachypleus tridentatus]|uniref:uncharacterized protein LOC143244653 isoform X2 n=1 Tax=Tachypleus tridentatus TaxID=6853 RepID=UPI003FD1BF30
MIHEMLFGVIFCVGLGWIVLSVTSMEFENRTIPDPSSYLYYSNPRTSSIQREYLILETHPRSFFLCPKHFFIYAISQKLILSEKLYQLPASKQWSEKAQNVTVNDALSNSVNPTACPTLNECLGYQGCLFKFGNEFCQQDPAESVRKVLNVNITCLYDESFFSQITNWKAEQAEWHEYTKQVLSLYYKSRVEEGIRDYARTVINKLVLQEDEIFSFFCPKLEEAQEKGYTGECGTEAPDAETASEMLWNVLGRVSTAQCREEIQQVFCAYKYNSRSACFPPFLIDHKEKKKKLSFKSLPVHGVWVNKAFHQKLLTYSNHHLIPTRLGFVLLIHQDIPAVMELLQLIYRPYYFYVIHVDVRARNVREELETKINMLELQSNNIRVLPKDRSFLTSWASYDIVRAQLEGFEELLRMGTWDFAINLSGADLPLRDVDDLAAALAQYRGLTFFPFYSWRNQNTNNTKPLLESALYACGGYVYNVSSMAGEPLSENLLVFSSSQWGVFSRNFVEYLLQEEERSEQLNKHQFYLQTSPVPDESYLVTAIVNSPFNKTLRMGGIRHFKRFSNTDIDNLCRHRNDADFCGQGPAVFEDQDIEELHIAAHRAFFARKFYTSFYHKTRMAAVKLVRQEYYSALNRFLDISIIRKLAEVVIQKLIKENTTTLGQFEVLQDVLNFRVFPFILPPSFCCFLPHQRGFRNTVQYKYWIDFQVTSSFGVTKCFGDTGHLKFLFATTWTRDIPGGKKLGLDISLPVPYGPAYVPVVWIQLYFYVEEDKDRCEDEASNQGTPLLFEDLNVANVQAKPLHLTLELIRSDGYVKCSQDRVVEWNNSTAVASNPEVEKPKIDMLTFSTQLHCGLMEPGFWTLRVFKANDKDPRTYEKIMLLLDFSEKIDLPTETISHLWKLEAAAFLPLPDFYVNTVENQNHINDFPHPLSHHSQQEKKDDKSVLHNGSCFSDWILCSGGIITLTLCFIFIYHWILLPLQRRRLSRQIHQVFRSFLLLAATVILQVLLLSHYC